MKKLDRQVLTLLGSEAITSLEIRDRLNQSRFFPYGFSALYPSLNRLEKKKLINWIWAYSQNSLNSRRRKLYYSTQLGLKVVEVIPILF